jgi:LacI family transcriptional regulator
VLVVLGTSTGWSRGILRGFVPFALEHGWNLVQYEATASLDWLARVWKPEAVVLGPEVERRWPANSGSTTITVSVNADRTADGLASVCLDEGQIAEVALAHLLSKGLTHLTTFRFDEARFGITREHAFRDAVTRSRGRLVAGWWIQDAVPSRAYEQPEAIADWLRHLPRPCGVFACCDAWARVVARYAHTAELRVPDDLSIVGVDNDTIQCELMAPPLSSVIVPWQAVGRQAAHLVRLALSGEAIAGRRIVIAPGHVMTRRSSDALAIADPLAARAVRWIHEHANRALTVPSVARALGTSRRRLERRFQAFLGRTVAQEIRRIRVETAKHWLSTTGHSLAHVAKLSGFTSAALLNVAFRRELGLPPGAYRRRVRGAPHDDD